MVPGFLASPASLSTFQGRYVELEEGVSSGPMEDLRHRVCSLRVSRECKLRSHGHHSLVRHFPEDWRHKLGLVPTLFQCLVRNTVTLNLLGPRACAMNPFSALPRRSRLEKYLPGKRIPRACRLRTKGCCFWRS